MLPHKRSTEIVEQIKTTSQEPLTISQLTNFTSKESEPVYQAILGNTKFKRLRIVRSHINIARTQNLFATFLASKNLRDNKD